MFNINDTIAAIATPLGEGGISVLRLSGEQAITIADKIFAGRSTLSESKSHTAHFGNIINGDGSTVDEVVATIFVAPNSYTGENVVEISCHGGVYITKKILELILNSGARLAEPGEFTKRAFINGKIDLLQAESVADIIHSRSELAHKSSINQLKGAISSKLSALRANLMNLCSLIELELDFVEEGYSFAEKEIIEGDLRLATFQIQELLNSFSIGRYYRDGIKIVITGKPNVGKSSLLNALLQKNRAIVTEIPGTTRDIIEDELMIEGVTFRFIDTAGIRTTNDIIEAEGVQRSHEQVAGADVILRVIDLIDNECLEANNLLKNVNTNTVTIFVFNKVDLISETEQNKIKENLAVIPNYIYISAKNRIGLKELEKKILESTIYSQGEYSNTLAITNIRHRDLLEKTIQSLNSAYCTVVENKTTELISVDLRSALNSLGEITGEVTSEEILNNVFSKFCIGK